MQHKIAANLLNSIGVSQNGELLVWGSNKHNILGKHDTNLSVFLPASLRIGGEEDKIVCDVSLGEYHAACVINDRFTNSKIGTTNLRVAKLVPLTYANEFFREIREHYADAGKKIEDHLERDILDFARELELATPAGQEGEDEQLSPYIDKEHAVTKECFCFYLQERMKILYKDAVSLAKLLGDVECESHRDYINIRELRDQILGFRYSNGDVCTWGLNENGRLGRPFDSGKFMASDDEPFEPKKIAFPLIDGHRPIIVKVSCGSSHTLALSLNGDVFSWGLGQRGCLGLGNVPETATPTQITKTADNTDFKSIKDIVSGSCHCLALSRYDMVYSWGCGISGRLGQGNEEHYNLPKLMNTLPEGVHFIKLAAGDTHSAGIATDFELYTWGDGAYGKLGHGACSHELVPRHVGDLALAKIIDVACGIFHTLCVTQNGKVYSFGGGAEGKLGLDAILDNDVIVPSRVLALDDVNIVELSAAPYHSLALSDEGHIFAWGSNRDGRLGIRSVKEVHMMPEVVPDNTFHQVAVQVKRQEDTEAYKEYDSFMRRIPRHPGAIASVEVTYVSVLSQRTELVRSVERTTRPSSPTLESCTCAGTPWAEDWDGTRRTPTMRKVARRGTKRSQPAREKMRTNRRTSQKPKKEGNLRRRSRRAKIRKVSHLCVDILSNRGGQRGRRRELRGESGGGKTQGRVHGPARGAAGAHSSRGRVGCPRLLHLLRSASQHGCDHRRHCILLGKKQGGPAGDPGRRGSECARKAVDHGGHNLRDDSLRGEPFANPDELWACVQLRTGRERQVGPHDDDAGGETDRTQERLPAAQGPCTNRASPDRE